MPPTATIDVIARISALGESDCEELGSGLLAQPVNAFTSLAYTVVGAAMVGWARAARGTERNLRWAFIVAMGATGIGSFLYHGPQGPASGFLHDITFLTVLAILAVANASAARGWAGRGTAAVLVAVVVAEAGLLVVSPGSTNALTGLSVLAVVTSDVLLFGRSGRATPWYGAAIVLAVLAVASLGLGRSDAPLCDPDVWYQPHGAWHVLGAAALASYAIATGSRRVVPRRDPVRGARV